MNRAAVVAAVAAGAVAVTAFFVLRPSTPEPVETVDVRVSTAPRARVSRAPAGTPAREEPDRRPAVEPTADAPAEEAAAPAVEEAAPTLGTLRIETDVAGAQVFIDRQFAGAAPLLAENITPGSHQLNISAEGFDSYAATVDVSPGSRDILVRFREVRLDTALDVIHRHRIGSCRGQLVATPQGLRYETSNRDDSFTVGLVELEAFEVDYLDKNLRVRLPRGRQFNFTDPDGNADRLFVFHRDVDKARARLRKGDPPATH
jgi:hypothetical protein